MRRQKFPLQYHDEKRDQHLEKHCTFFYVYKNIRYIIYPLYRQVEEAEEKRRIQMEETQKLLESRVLTNDYHFLKFFKSLIFPWVISPPTQILKIKNEALTHNSGFRVTTLKSELADKKRMLTPIAPPSKFREEVLEFEQKLQKVRQNFDSKIAGNVPYFCISKI